MQRVWSRRNGIIAPAWVPYTRAFFPLYPLWFVSKKVDFGTERTFFVHDLRRDEMVPVALQDILSTTNAATQTYTSKTSWNNSVNSVESIGGGGAGARGASTSTSGGGGGAGAYNRISNFSFATPGTTTAEYKTTAGLLHTGSYPGTAPDCWFNGATLGASSCGAKGGVSPATATSATGAAGGLASGGVPTTSPPGRNGGNGANAGGNNSSGGGGGGAGGPNGAGGNGSGTTGGTADGGMVAGGAPGNPGSANEGDEWTATDGCGSGAGGANAGPGTGGTAVGYGGAGGGGGRSNGVGGDGFQGVNILQSVYPEFADISADNAAYLLKTIIAIPYR